MKINEQTIRQACNLLAETLIQKNHDYGDSVEEQFKEYGETSLLIRLDDKLRRLKQLQNAPAKVTSESKQDTYFDLAGYSVLDYILLSSETKYDMNFMPIKNPHFDQDDQ